MLKIALQKKKKKEWDGMGWGWTLDKIQFKVESKSSNMC